MMTAKTVCLEVALLISQKDQKTSLFSEDQEKVWEKVLSLPYSDENQHKSFFQWWLRKLFV